MNYGIRIITGLAPLTIFTSCRCEKNSQTRPNVLVIILDDAGYNDFGFMGCADLLTPNIDSLAANGMVFTDAHVSSTVSGPSRCGLLTGRYQQRGGYECNLDHQYGMSLDEETIGDIFSRNGYNTVCVGKWHQGAGKEYHPNKRGFSDFYGFISGSRSYFYRPGKDDKPGDERNLQHNGEVLSFNGYMTDILADYAAGYIQSNVDKPFMMYLAFNAVHTPMEATKEDLERFSSHPRQKLAAMTWAVDRGIGKVIAALKETGKFDNTLIFFLSDNGGAHNNQSSNYPLKGFKGNEFEGGHRVPFFVVYGDRLHGTYDNLVSSLDILPTVMGAAAIDTSALLNRLDGVNLLPYITGDDNGLPHEILFWRKNHQAAVRTASYKYIRVDEVGERLYDLSGNVLENEDLCDSLPDIAGSMRSSLEEWEKGMITPVLWDEGKWEKVNIDIHRNLMENKEVDCKTPEEYNRKYETKR